MFAVVHCHITLEYRFESVQTQGHFSNTAVHLGRANGRGFRMARTLMLWLLRVQPFTCPSSFPVWLPVDWSFWKNWPSAYNVRLPLRCWPETTVLKALLHCQDTIQHCKAIHNFCFQLSSDCSCTRMDSCLMTAVHVLMQLHWDPLCQAWAFLSTKGLIQGE